MIMRWHVKKIGGGWWAIGCYAKRFDSWEDAIEWTRLFHGTEPTA
ncbi:hypothetical protein GCM10027061_21070 [Nesterenkonia suensis]